ncbi:MAG TPA: DoxX family membrane protein, partial [Thermoanaerobaculia bacterium]|nr:DoxX family membrane protein [Thermoanaerobaculia bacterium]
PVPKLGTWLVPLAYASGVLLIAVGLGMLLPRTARLATLVLTIHMAAWVVLTLLPSLFASPGVEVRWLALGEGLMLFAGGWILLAAVSPGDGGQFTGPGQVWQVRLARLLYAVALPMVGLSHFFYLKLTASMVPGWLPFHTGFAYLTGAAHIAAGLGLLFGILPRLAATAEAAMISLFIVSVNVPVVLGHPGDHFQLADLFVGVALSGAAWGVAGSLADASWGLRGARPRPTASSSLV